MINAKYNDFVGLANQLSGVEGAVVRMGKPLTELKVKDISEGKVIVMGNGIEKTGDGRKGH